MCQLCPRLLHILFFVHSAQLFIPIFVKKLEDLSSQCELDPQFYIPIKVHYFASKWPTEIHISGFILLPTFSFPLPFVICLITT